MPWHAVPTYGPGQVINDTDWANYIRDNPTYLLGGRPDIFTVVPTGADYAISVTAFADIDAANLILSPTLSGPKYLCIAQLAVAPAASHYIYLDWILDGTTRAGGTLGVAAGQGSGIQPVTVTALFSGLTAGPHTFKLQARIDTATFNATIYRNNMPITLIGLEVG